MKRGRLTGSRTLRSSDQGAAVGMLWEVRSIFRPRRQLVPNLVSCLGLFLLITGILLLASGCAPPRSSRQEPQPRDGIAQYRHVAVDARKAMRAALKSLSSVSAQSSRCSPRVLKAFSASMQRLQVDSMSLRARVRAMQARGDAYIEQWEQHQARVDDPEVRTLAQRRRPLYEQSFRRIKLLSQEAREAFGPCVSSLRELRNALENDPASLSTPATQARMTAARQHGEHVELEAGLGILQEAYANYQQDLGLGRRPSVALRDMCQVLRRGADVWLEEFNQVCARLRVGR